MKKINSQSEKIKFWIVIPSWILTDENLSSTEKLILAEIYSLADEKGICYANNKYFAQIFGLTITQVSRCIHKLKKCNYIDVKILKNEGNKRLIILTKNPYG